MNVFKDFWQASSFNRFSIRDFAASSSLYDSDQKELFLSFPEAGTALPKLNTAASKIAKKRTSQRVFTNKPLTKKDIGRIVGSFYAINGLEHRAYPSAGATYCTEVFIVNLNTAKSFCNTVCYYNPQKHSLVKVANAPKWNDIQDKINVSVNGMPQSVVLFVSFYNRATQKYGERGGRFALIEAGAAMQQLALTIASSKNLRGVAAGGLYDDYWLSVIGLNSDEAGIALGYLCGK